MVTGTRLIHGLIFDLIGYHPSCDDVMGAHVYRTPGAPPRPPLRHSGPVAVTSARVFTYTYMYL